MPNSAAEATPDSATLDNLLQLDTSCQNCTSAWNYNLMEERVELFYLGQQLSLTLHQIANLQPLVKPDDLRQMSLPPLLSKFQPCLQVLHACLYYVLCIAKGVYSLSATSFRQKCLAAIQTYYIHQNMNFQLYQYAYLCSKLLSYSLQKSLHIIYFLLYARLASSPYILSISQAEIVRKCARKQTCRLEREGSAFSNERDSRHLTVFVEDGQVEVQSFKKDLRKVFNPGEDLKKTSKKCQNKRYFNIKKFQPDQDNQYKLQQSAGQLTTKGFSAASALRIPLKVGPFDQSSVINRLKLHSKKRNTGDGLDLYRTMMRRQKFKEEFNGCERYESLRREERQERRERGTQMLISEEKTNRLQKHAYQYFREITRHIKSSNRQLDLIRTECTSHNNLIRSNIGTKEQLFSPQTHYSPTAADTPTLITHTSPKWSFNLANLQSQRKQNTLQASFREQQLKSENGVKKQYYTVMSEASPRVADLLNGVITRKNDRQTHQQQVGLFGKPAKGKIKLQKYKEEYRNFLKNQLFQNIKTSA